MITLIHGFWGQPADWRAVLERLPLHVDVWTPDIWLGFTRVPSFRLWAEGLRRELDARGALHDAPVLVGYSLGARLLLMAQAQGLLPENARVLLLSARPFLEPSEIASRQVWEEEWAARFRRDDWSLLGADWDRQEVFASALAESSSRAGRPRRCHDDERELLAQALTLWSPRHHGLAAADLRRFPARVEWAFGTMDQKYQLVAKSLRLNGPPGQIHDVAGSGHRILLERPDWVAEWIVDAQLNARPRA
jgi:pimeloyl-ACP methyl ester carboxylesterase